MLYCLTCHTGTAEQHSIQTVLAHFLFNFYAQPGSYKVIASKPVYLTSQPINISVYTDICIVSDIKLLSGDITCDNKINFYDLLVLANLYGQIFECTNLDNWYPAADLNRDNKVDLFDLVFLARNYGKEGYKSTVTS